MLFNHDALTKTGTGSHLLYRLLGAQEQQHFRGRVMEASERAIGAASSTQHAQGVVASFQIEDPGPPHKSADDAPVLICDDIQDPGNLGTILRSASAAGVAGVLLTGDCVDLYNPKVVRAGMGAHFRLPIYHDLSWERIAQSLEEMSVELGRLFATEAGATRTYDEVDWTQPAGLVVSNEAHGLSIEARKAAQGGLISIPMKGGTESLNAAMAATIVLFEAARQRRRTGGA